MKKIAAIALISTCALILHAGDFIVLDGNGWREDFDSFEGTYASLPDGLSVSKDGTNSMMEGDSDFRGINDGNLSTGGCYAWQPAVSNLALGYQPTTTEFTPGYFQAAFSNSSTRIFRFLKIEYDFVWLNNENRASKLQLEIHYESGSTSTVSAVTRTTEEAEDPRAAWSRSKVACSVVLNPVMPPGTTFKLRWYGDDSSGSGARDEYGIDNIYVIGIQNRGTVITLR